MFAGPQQGPQRLQQTVDSNTDVISSINRAIEEVAILKANLIKKEVCLADLILSKNVLVSDIATSLERLKFKMLEILYKHLLYFVATFVLL